MGVRARVLLALAAASLVLAGCGEEAGGVIKPESNKIPLSQSGAEKGK